MSYETIKVISVAELNRYVSALLGSKEVLQDLRIRAEISGLRRYPSGHIYFSLKDERAQVSCVMFRGHASRLTFEPQDGQAVIASAKASLYERDGRFQLQVTALEEEGIGGLHAAFERLRKKLEDEGLFAEERKRPLPYLPKTIGVVTSPQGAVLRDILNVLERRYPGFRLILAPAAVQGQTAAAELARGIENLNRDGRAEVIIVGRGGGSLEDLWAFNEEILARAIFASTIPVVSAVGHETDTTICDYVADLRAPTPSAAAELVVPVRSELEQYLDQQNEALKRNLLQKAREARQRLGHLARAEVLQDPRNMLRMRTERIERLERGMIQALRDELHKASTRVLRHESALGNSMDRTVSRRRERLSSLAGSLDALSPLAVLKRGYGYVTDQAGETVTGIEQLAVNSRIDLRLVDGVASCQVQETKQLADSGAIIASAEGKDES